MTSKCEPDLEIAKEAIMKIRIVRMVLIVTIMTFCWSCGSSDRLDSDSANDRSAEDHESSAIERDAALAAAGIVNTTCPIMNQEVDPSLSVNYEGTKVGLCCQGCFSKWYELSDAEKRAKLAAVTTDSGSD